MPFPGFKMRGGGWQAIWAFIAVLAAIRTLGELFRHGWSSLVLVGLLSFAAALVFALLARRGLADPGGEASRLAPAERRRQALRPADPILPGRRFF